MKDPLSVKNGDRALPSPYEEHSGEMKDPTGHSAEIDGAKRKLLSFIEDMDANRVPAATLDSLVTSADILCTYAGCPYDAIMFVDYLISPEAASSYRRTAVMVKVYLAEVSEMIDARLTIAARSTAPIRSNRHLNDDDLPF